MKSKLSGVKPAWVIGVVIALIVIVVGVIALKPKKLNGNYSAEVTVLFIKSKDTLKFTRDNKVVEYQDGKKGATGTYKIDGKNLNFNLDSTAINAKLADDHKSFKVTSGSGSGAAAAGITYTLED